jgi:hypothetical protein
VSALWDGRPQGVAPTIFARLNHYPPIIFIGIRRRIYSIEDQAGHTSNALRSVEQSFRKEIAAATNCGLYLGTFWTAAAR